jgi:hypothetical protein
MESFSQRLDAQLQAQWRKATLQDIAGVTGPSPELFKFLESISQFKVFSKSHVLFRQGEPIRRLFVIRTGWAHLTRAGAPPEERFLGSIHCLGVEGISRIPSGRDSHAAWSRRSDGDLAIEASSKSGVPRTRLEGSRTSLGDDIRSWSRKQSFPILQAQQRLIETGLVDGTNLLLMDMELCVRCGNCSLACHQSPRDSLVS